MRLYSRCQADPVKAMFGDKPVNEAVAAQIRSEYNLDKPFIVQYLLFLKNALSLNFGNTFAGQPVIDEISRAFPVTLKLAIMAFCFEAIFGCVFGAISGLKKGKWYDSVILIVSLLLISVPTFVTGFVGQYFLGVKGHIFPVTAGADPYFFDLLLPAMVLGSVSMAYIIQPGPFRDLVEHRTGLRAHRPCQGHEQHRGHVPSHSAQFDDPGGHLPSQDLGALMGGAMITEQIFNIHGIGYLTYQSILKGEANLVVSVVTLLTLVFVICNLIVDMLYAALDPRIRYV